MAVGKSTLWLVVMFLITAVSALAENRASPPVMSQESAPAGTGAPVMFENETLLVIYDRLGPFTPHERAQGVMDRLTRLANDPLAGNHPIVATHQEQTSELVHGEMVVMTITDRDAQPTGVGRQELAQRYADKLQSTLNRSREQLTFRALLIDAGLALLDTVILIVLLALIHKAFPKLYDKIDAWRGTVIPAIRIQRVELVSAGQIAAGLTACLRAIRVVGVLFLLYLYLTTVLGIFPWTRAISARLIEAVISTLSVIGLAFSTYVPNIVSIAVIVFITRYIIKLISLLFTGIERGAISFTGFYREWAQPTYKIVRFLVIVFAAIACFPYIPGSQSEGFRGISVFLGLLFSLGSAGAISNIIAGVVLTYMRPFRVGDRVKIADTTGDVTEKTLLVTRVRTIKNVDVTIPNAMVLGSHLINFSSCAPGEGLILHTSVTIGYDAPWKKVHELLIAAARATTHILAKPEPFVQQTSLNDFYVTYEINAYTDRPNAMAAIYAELHQHIQDTFNEAGVEIMSPHYAQIRDGNKSTIPNQYLPRHYEAPGLRIWPLTGGTTSRPARPSDSDLSQK